MQSELNRLEQALTIALNGVDRHEIARTAMHLGMAAGRLGLAEYHSTAIAQDAARRATRQQSQKIADAINAILHLRFKQAVQAHIDRYGALDIGWNWDNQFRQFDQDIADEHGLQVRYTSLEHDQMFFYLDLLPPLDQIITGSITDPVISVILPISTDDVSMCVGDPSRFDSMHVEGLAQLDNVRLVDIHSELDRQRIEWMLRTDQDAA